MAIVVAIDGPAASGKSSVAREVAARVHFSYVDTGAIYRALGLYAKNLGVSADDEERLAALATQLPLVIISKPEGQRYFLDTVDVTQTIRSEEVSQLASIVSKHPKVRAELLDLQRRLGREAKNGAVLAGRDIGTVVFPEADFKFFLTASSEERAKRRYEELLSHGEASELSQVLAEIKERDARDSQRAVAPMRPADDAKVVDTTPLSLEEVIQSIVSVIHGANKSR